MPGPSKPCLVTSCLPCPAITRLDVPRLASTRPACPALTCPTETNRTWPRRALSAPPRRNSPQLAQTHPAEPARPRHALPNHATPASPHLNRPRRNWPGIALTGLACHASTRRAKTSRDLSDRNPPCLACLAITRPAKPRPTPPCRAVPCLPCLNKPHHTLPHHDQTYRTTPDFFTGSNRCASTSGVGIPIFSVVPKFRSTSSGPCALKVL